MRRYRLKPLLVVVLLALATAAAPSPAAAVPTAESLSHERAGAKAYRLGDFRLAIEEFRLAYQLDANPIFLFNLGQCHRQLGESERAIFFYKQYLADAPPTSRFRDAAMEKLAELERLVRQQKETRESPPACTVPSSPGEPLAASPAPSPAPAKLSGWPLGLSITGVAAGGAAVLAGGVLGAHAGTLERNANAQPSLGQRNDDHRQATAEAIAAAVVAGVGLAALVAGAVILAGHPTKEAPGRASLWIAPSVGGIVAGGTF